MQFGSVFWNRMLYAFILLLLLAAIVAGILLYNVYGNVIKN
jgi:hypothetical protein